MPRPAPVTRARRPLRLSLIGPCADAVATLDRTKRTRLRRLRSRPTGDVGSTRRADPRLRGIGRSPATFSLMASRMTVAIETPRSAAMRRKRARTSIGEHQGGTSHDTTLSPAGIQVSNGWAKAGAPMVGCGPRAPFTSRSVDRPADLVRAGHPRVVRARRSRRPTDAQAQGWPAIAAGEHTLICAPTGSGKTLAAFLWCLDRLRVEAPPADPRERLSVLYVSPLKALVHDVDRNLRAPLAGMALAGAAPRGAAARDPRRHADRGHAGGGAADVRPQAAGHPRHDTRVAVPDPHVAGARGAAVGPLGHRRRDPRARRHEARRPPRAVARAARSDGGASAAADRPVGHPAAVVGGRRLPRGPPAG